MSALLRPDARPGELIGAGAVALTITVALLNVRFEDEWGVGIHFVYSALAATLAIGLAATADHAPNHPRRRGSPHQAPKDPLGRRMPGRWWT